MSRDKKQNDNSTDSTKIISYLIAIPIAFLFCVIDSCESCRKKDNYYGDISSNYSERVDENIHGAWAYATLFVERELYSPKSAKYGFAPAREAVTPLGDCTYKVESYVDANNRFGVKTRSYFELTIKELIAENKWELIEGIYFSNKDVCADPLKPEIKRKTTPEKIYRNTTEGTNNSTFENNREESGDFDAEVIREHARKLYEELISFKNNPEFITLGFGLGSKYNRWLKEIKQLDSMIPKGIPQNEQELTRFDIGVAVGQIEMLGLEYLNTNGFENEFTSYSHKEIKKVVYKNNNSSSKVESTLHTAIEPELDEDALRKRAKELYEELISFKNDPEFITFGFGVEKYNRWLKEIELLSKSKPTTRPKNAQEQIRFNIGMAINQIKTLGHEYLNTKGEENKSTADCHREIKNILYINEDHSMSPYSSNDASSNGHGEESTEDTENVFSFQDWTDKQGNTCIKDSTIFQYDPINGEVTHLSSTGVLSLNPIDLFSEEDQNKIQDFIPISDGKELELFDQLVSIVQMIPPPQKSSKAYFGVKIGDSVKDISETIVLIKTPFKGFWNSWYDFETKPSEYDKLGIHAINGRVTSIEGRWKDYSPQFTEKTLKRFQQKYKQISPDDKYRYYSNIGVWFFDEKQDTIIQVIDNGSSLRFIITNEESIDYYETVCEAQNKFQKQIKQILNNK